MLFPLGRSDRAYVFLSGDAPADLSKLGRGIGNQSISCYQRKGNTYKLVYRANLAYGVTSTKKAPAQITSLRDYLTSDDLLFGSPKGSVKGTIKSKISHFAENDLAAKRDYVFYKYIFGPGIFRVSLLSALHNDGIPSEGNMFDLEEDPLTKAKMSDNGFFNKYGFPIAQEELALFHDAPD